MPTYIISGIGGVVSGAKTIRNWSAAINAGVKEYRASGGRGATGAVEGNVSWTGKYDAYGHTPAAMPGEPFLFKGSIDGAKGVSGAARVDSVEITCGIEGADIIAHTVNFKNNGVLNRGASVASDVSVPNPPTSIGTKVYTATPGGAWSPVNRVRNWRLSISADNPAYVDSDSGGQEMCEAGNIDANWSFAMNTDDFSLLLGPNAIKGVRLYVTSGTYWEILWGIVSGLSDLLVDREAAAIVGGTVNMRLTNAAEIGSGTSPTPTLGQIVMPDGTIWWPAATGSGSGSGS